MGDIPAERVTPNRPFLNTGVDLCGPFFIKNKRQRNSSAFKVYVASFICFVTKAVHLEIVSDLTAESFIACLKRFIYRRGKCNSLWSDNATNFVGSKNELKSLNNSVEKQIANNKISEFCVSEEINWKFIPPRAPNFGGLWESSIKSFKSHLKRVTLGHTLSYEELNTLIIQIEGIMNSRPLSPLSTDPNDPQPLTPGHFLVGAPIVVPAEPSYLDTPSNRLSNWQKIFQMTQSFWKRFSIEYVNTLQQRQKWKSTSQNIKIGDLVLIAEENLPSTQWMLGRIIKVFPGHDGKIRVVEIKTKSGILKRSISKISKLPIET